MLSTSTISPPARGARTFDQRVISSNKSWHSVNWGALDHSRVSHLGEYSGNISIAYHLYCCARRASKGKCWILKQLVDEMTINEIPVDETDQPMKLSVDEMAS